jgi:hypothetical protein
MITDPYLFLHLSTFLQLRDFVNLAQTSRQYTGDPLITDEISKRLYTSTSVNFVSFTNSIRLSLTHMYNFQMETCLVFTLQSPLPLYEIQNDLPTMYKQMRFYFCIPGWDYEWSGNILCDNDITDLKYTDFVYNVTKSAFGSVDLVLYRDEDHLFVREIRFKYTRKTKGILKKMRWKQVAYQVSALTATVYIAYCEKQAGRIATMVVALLTAMYISDGVENNVRLTPHQNNI